ncbi:TPA: YihY/virulence factor BrkB family protein [Streptococcus suis]
MKKQTLKSQCKQFFASFFSFYMSAELDITSVAVAYYLIISIFPILMTLANLLPYLSIDVNQILAVVVEIFPEKLYPSVSRLIVNILTQPSSSWLGISIFTTLWTISRSMTALQKAVNKAYGVNQHRDFIIGHVVGVFLGIALQLIIMLGVAALTFGQTLQNIIRSTFSMKDSWISEIISQTQPIAYLTLFLALMMLYFFLPNVRIKKIRYVLPGTLFVLIVMGTMGHVFGYYVDSYASRLLDFRFVTSVIFLVLMLWFVFMANILITGAVFNATVQSMQIDEFDARSGDIVSILNRLKARFTPVDSENDSVEKEVS